nr:signal-transducing adaptor protein 1 isoform X1 [Nothobranchius furzeri]
MSAHPRVVHNRRQTITALPLYYSGHLLKKSTGEKDFKSYYGELRGESLFLYKDDTQDTYSERLELAQLKSMELDSPYQKKMPTIFTLNLPTEEVHLKMDNADTGEEWRGYILTVVNREIPAKLQLLPGQMIKLGEVLVQENCRNPKLTRPPLPPRPMHLKPQSSQMPSCFLDVTRQEAEKMLEANLENGSIILRPSAMPKNYALTLRQKTSRGPVLKNYRVTSTKSGFVIELETPVTVPSLNDVLKFFLEKTEYRLCPYVDSQPYDTHILPSSAPECVSIPSPSSIAPPKAQVAPLLRSQTKEKLPPPPHKPDEGEYVVPDDSLDHNRKLAQLGNELRKALKTRRENIYSESGQDEADAYENEADRRASWTVQCGGPKA